MLLLRGRRLENCARVCRRVQMGVASRRRSRARRRRLVRGQVRVRVVMMRKVLRVVMTGRRCRRVSGSGRRSSRAVLLVLLLLDVQGRVGLLLQLGALGVVLVQLLRVVLLLGARRGGGCGGCCCGCGGRNCCVCGTRGSAAIVARTHHSRIGLLVAVKRSLRRVLLTELSLLVGVEAVQLLCGQSAVVVVVVTRILSGLSFVAWCAAARAAVCRRARRVVSAGTRRRRGRGCALAARRR